jgi:hypothetical protein
LEHNINPKVLMVVSDMQWDSGGTGYQKNLVEIVKELYRKAERTMPRLVWWNVANTKTSPVQALENGAVLVDGYSTAILRKVLDFCGKGADVTFNPLEMMIEILDRYPGYGA